MKIASISRLIVSILVCQLAGVVGSAFTRPAISSWYATLRKPTFTPPNWLFGPVWISLFLLMGISAYLIWSKGLQNRKVIIALSIFGIQLVLNMLWSFLFFKLQSPVYAFIEILILWFAILFTIIYFFKISRAASFLLFPYIFWVSFAVILNSYIWKLNP
ncbi:tryptophan-rich sensory protein [bacterium]|nr:tryptophan-rich sensory protein [bacterium]NIN91828.1 tryptophan-rich sensory protein [bacterium]NIO18114.1 tryptophan-rich sensory protein [bacterium]NIO73079.1 tryptophan-rich sensory protein [bacterium]